MSDNLIGMRVTCVDSKRMPPQNGRIVAVVFTRAGDPRVVVSCESDGQHRTYHPSHLTEI